MMDTNRYKAAKLDVRRQTMDEYSNESIDSAGYRAGSRSN